MNSLKKLPNPGETTPTLNFNISQMILDDIEFVIWDAPGQVNYRRKWQTGMSETQILCFILDMLNPDSFEEAKRVFEKVVNDNEMRNIPLIICFHKLDVPDAKKNLPKARGMFSPDLISDRKVHSLETTIFNPDSIIKLKELFVEIVEQSRW